MEREASPDWLREFKSPTEDAFMILSSSPSSSSREVPEKYSALRDLEGTSENNQIEEDSPLVSALDTRKTIKVAGSGRGTPRRKGKTPVKQKEQGNSVPHAVEEDDAPDDDGEDDKVFSSRRPRAGKRSVDSDEDEDDYKPPTKRKTGPSPKKKTEGRKTPNSSKKKKRDTIAEEEENVSLKRVKRVIELGPVDTAVEEDGGDDELAPISRLSSATRTSMQPALDVNSVDGATISQSSKGRHGAGALRALVEDELADEDELGQTQKEELIAEEEIGEPSEKKSKRSGSTLPVLFADKIHRTKVLLECEGDALDLSGDIGAVGRFSVSSRRETGEDELFLDLKGVIYRTTIVPSNTFFVVNVGQTEAKVEAIMSDFMQLRPDVNQAGDETVVEGTLEGFAFDLDNEGDGGATANNHPAPVDGDDEEFDEKAKKKILAKGQGKKVAASKGKVKGNAKGAGKKPRAKAKTAAKKPAKPKPAAARKPKATKG